MPPPALRCHKLSAPLPAPSQSYLLWSCEEDGPSGQPRVNAAVTGVVLGHAGAPTPRVLYALQLFVRNPNGTASYPPPAIIQPCAF